MVNDSLYGERFDSVRILGVQALGKHGVFPHEKEEKKPFIADIEAVVDASDAALNDDLSFSISYADLAADAVAVIEGESVDLIETLAERIASRVLARGALAVEVTLHKPEAPVGLPFSDACVTLRRKGELLREGTIRRVVVALGSNMGDSAALLAWAVECIRELPVCVNAVSDIITSAAQLAPGQATQPDYLNAVLTLTTAMSPLELLRRLQEIEVRGGRVRHEKWGARTLDIDIVDVEGVASAHSVLTLPHPRAHERLFVLEPWMQIEPDAVLGELPVADHIDFLISEKTKECCGTVTGGV